MVILIGAGLSAGDLGFESLQCSARTHKVARRQNMGAMSRPVIGVCRGTFPGRLGASLYAVHSWVCVHYRWHFVSLEEKANLGKPLVLKP